MLAFDTTIAIEDNPNICLNERKGVEISGIQIGTKTNQYFANHKTVSRGMFIHVHNLENPNLFEGGSTFGLFTTAIHL